MIINLFKAYVQTSKGYLKNSQWWLFFMVIMNFFIPLFLIMHRQAQVTLFSSFLAVAIGLIIFKIDGYSRLLSLMHLPWVFLVWYLTDGFFSRSHSGLLSLWIAGVIVTNSVSLLFDIRDFILYMKGNKQYPEY